MSLRFGAFLRKALLALLLLAGTGGWGAIGFLIAFTGPEEGINEVVFLVLLLIAASSVTTIIAYRFSFSLFSFKRYQGSLWRAFLQGIPMGVFIAMIAWLQALRLLNWDAVLITLSIVVVVELLLLPRGAT